MSVVNHTNTMERGLLDLSVELSSRNITAGNQFALFVLVKNPFDKPVWIRRVHVSLPSELKLADSEKAKEEALATERIRKESTQKITKEHTKLETKLGILDDNIKELKLKLDDEQPNSDDIRRLLQRLEWEMEDLQEKVDNINLGMTRVDIVRGKVKDVKVASNSARVNVVGNDDVLSEVGYLEISDSWLVHEQRAQAQRVYLESSLPPNTALQPGSTVVYTAVLSVKRSLIFMPSQYRLQFNVNYSFDAPPKQKETIVLNLE